MLIALAGLLPVAASDSDGPAPSASQPPAVVGKAPVALLVDLSSGQTLYAKNEDRRFLPASVTKAMTTLVAFDLIADGRLREDSVVTVRPETAARWAGKGTTLNLRPNEAITVRQLLQGTATVSANDAAVALGEAALGSADAWIAVMNARARELGMDSSHFSTPNGFPDRGATYVTARDLVKLAAALISDHPDLYRRYVGQQAMDWRGSRLASHDPFAGILPGADGIKTGHTFEAGFNFLGAVQRADRRLVLVVAGLRTETDRAQVAKVLAEWGYDAWKGHRWIVPGMVLGQVQVQQGSARSVPVTVARPWMVTLPTSAAAPRLSARIVYSGPLVAPIASDAVIGRLEVHVEGQPAYSVPLVAANAVDSAGPLDRMINGLAGLMP